MKHAAVAELLILGVTFCGCLQVQEAFSKAIGSWPLHILPVWAWPFLRCRVWVHSCNAQGVRGKASHFISGGLDFLVPFWRVNHVKGVQQVLMRRAPLNMEQNVGMDGSSGLHFIAADVLPGSDRWQNLVEENIDAVLEVGVDNVGMSFDVANSELGIFRLSNAL